MPEEYPSVIAGCGRFSHRMVHGLLLWFGDQDAKDERSPVYGTAMAVEYLSTSRNPLARKLAENGLGIF